MNDGFEFEGTFSCRPTVLHDFIKLSKQIWDAYRYLDDKDEDVRKLFDPIMGAACDFACNLTDELGFEDVNELIEDEYVVLTYYPDGTIVEGYSFKW